MFYLAIGNASLMLLINLYADDTSVLLNGNNYSNLIELLNSELEKLSIWLKCNKLTLNVQKTYYMVFHRSRVKTDTHAVITMDDVCLQRTDSFKYLGVIIITNLTGRNILIMLKTKFPKE